MKTACYSGEDFFVAVQNPCYKIGLLRYSDRFSRFGMLERHLNTEESFVLLCGSATFYAADASFAAQSREMKPLTVYTAERGEWHHIVVSPDATVLVAEDAGTSRENTEKKYFE